MNDALQSVLSVARGLPAALPSTFEEFAGSGKYTLTALLASYFVIASLALYVFFRITRRSNRARPDSNHTQEYDVAIVGAGVCGAALAVTLARQGRTVLLVESEVEVTQRRKDKIIGELLQPNGYMQLQALGLENCVEGIDAVKCNGYYIYTPESKIWLDFPTAPQTPGLGFHNYRFVEKLRAECHKLSERITFVDGRVTGVLRADDDDSAVTGIRYKPAAVAGAAGAATDQEEVSAHAGLSVIADGCFSAFRNSKQFGDFTDRQTTSKFIGVLVEDLPVDFANVVLADPSPVLFYPVSKTEVRVLVDCPVDQLPRDMAEHMRTKVAPQLPPLIRERFLAAVATGKFVSMPNQVMGADPEVVRGAVLVGDALNMRHPVTGAGMTVGLTDVVKLSRELAAVPDFGDLEVVTNAVQTFYDTRKAPNSTLNMLADALYGCMIARYPDLRAAFFDYVALGSIHAEHPMRLLSGVSRNQYVIIFHYVLVALHGTFRILAGRVRRKSAGEFRVARAYRLLRTATRVMLPCIVRESTCLPLVMLGYVAKVLFCPDDVVRDTGAFWCK